MEKQGVVKKGVTPSEVSGKKSVMIKNGHALAKGEKDTLSDAEQRLEQTMEPLYNNGG